MRKKINLLLVVLLLVTVIPFNVFAKESNTFMSKSYKPFMVDNDLDYVKQQMNDDIDEIYEIALDKTYIDEVKSYLEFAYNDVMDTINNANSLDDIVDMDAFSYGIISYNDDVYYKKLFLVMLADFSYPIVRENTDFYTIKEKAIKNVDYVFDGIDYYEYNDYYTSKFDYLKEIVYENYDDVSDYDVLAYANANVFKILYENLDDMEFEFNYSNVDYDYNYKSSKFYSKKLKSKSSNSKYTLKEMDDELSNRLGVITYEYMNIDLSKIVYTEDELWTLRDDYINLLGTFMESIPDNGYYGDGFYEMLQDDFYEAKTASEIVNIFENYKDEFQEGTGVKFKKMSDARKQRVHNQVYKLSLKYLDSSKYSALNYGRLEYIFTAVQDFYNNAVYDFEVPDYLIENLESLLEDVPTLKQELNSAKSKYTGYLKQFLNNKKYNQTKVRPIVNEGVKKINSATSVSAVKSIYTTYYNKAKKTINTYKITTSKEGMGSITKSKTVNYGTNLTISITPSKGYKLKYLYVDGKKVKVTTKYTFKNIRSNHKIKAVFAKN
ncbi:MAG: hypothetical protein Q4C29_01670 [bacterium]|nr:hypothetical protein [bacterium]